MCLLSGSLFQIEGQAPPSATERTARNLGIDLEIVGRDHPGLPDLQDGSRRHGSFVVNFKEGGINFARLERVPMLRQVFVFYRNWQDEQPLDARAVGCPANAYSALEDPVECFRAILRKMEGGRGPVKLQVRYYGRDQVAATFDLSSVAIPWSYVKHYGGMSLTEKKSK